MKLLIVEDEAKLAGYLRKGLVEEGHVVEVASNGIDGLHLALEGRHDLIVLDSMLPGIDGLSLLAALRPSKQTPVIMLTARHRVEDRVQGLKAGADDYLVKPFAMDLLTAKVQAVLRRVNAVQEKSLEKFGCELNLLTNDLDFQGESVRLTPTEGLIMKLLMLNANQTVSKKKLISALWQGNNFIDENALNVNLSRLRGKLSTLEGPLQITTVRGQGYRLEEKL